MSRALFTLAALGAALVPVPASARCAPVSVEQDAQQSAFVVEAVVERTGPTGELRVVAAWKGESAPARVSLSSRRGRGEWAWGGASSVGRRFVLFLRPNDGGGFYVARCGETAEANDRLREQLRALGLRSRPR